MSGLKLFYQVGILDALGPEEERLSFRRRSSTLVLRSDGRIGTGFLSYVVGRSRWTRCWRRRHPRRIRSWPPCHFQVSPDYSVSLTGSWRPMRSFCHDVVKIHLYWAVRQAAFAAAPGSRPALSCNKTVERSRR